MNKENEFLFRYLKSIKVPFSEAQLLDEMAAHPNSPSLKSYADILSDLKVSNMAVKLDKNDLFEIEDFPVIVHLKSPKGGVFALLESLNEKQVTYFSNGNKETESLDDFLKKWTGATLLLAAPEEKQKASLALKLRQNTNKLWIAASATLMLTALFSFYLSQDWLDAVTLTCLIALMASGLYFSILLTLTHLNKNGSDQYCRKTKNVSCEAVIFSKWGKLFGLFDLSQVGLVFFSGNLLLLLFYSITLENALINSFFVINSLALLFSFYSLYLQAFIIKKWCILCVYCQFSVISSVILYALVQDITLQGFTFGLSTFLLLAIAFIVPIAISEACIRNAQLIEKRRRELGELAKFKGNRAIFKFLHLQQKKHPDLNEVNGLILLGSTEARYEILMVASLFCNPCASRFRALANLIAEKPDVFNLRVIFGTDRNNELYSKVLIGLAKDNNQPQTIQAINKWYKVYSQEARRAQWLEEYKSMAENPGTDFDMIIKGQKEWLEAAKIEYTPSVFLNGHEIPSYYSNIKDLKRVLE